MELPPVVAEFTARLTSAGFEETSRGKGSMDSGWVAFRRKPMEIQLLKDRSQWSVELRDVRWRESIAFPLLEGFGHSGAAGDPFAPRRDRDPARDYDVPDSVRWLIRSILHTRLAEPPGSRDPERLVFRRDSVTVSLERDPAGWSARVHCDEWDSAPELTLPRFEGFAEA